MKKKLFFLTLATTVTIPALVISMPVHADNSAGVKAFKDVPTSHVYYKEICDMTSKGIIHGYENSMFKPNELITRQHAAALLARAYPSKDKVSMDFKDMSKGNAYHADMSLAIKSGWLEAKDGKVRPNDTVTRGEMAQALTIAAKLTDDSTTNFDLTDASPKYKRAITILLNSKVTTGYGDKTFKENEGLSRAHYSVFMYRAMNYVANKQEANKDSLYGNSYIGGYETYKVPAPNGVTLEQQREQYEELAILIPKGAFKGVFPGHEAKLYDGVVNQIVKASGVDQKQVSKYIDESAKTGKIVYFNGSGATKYFVIFGHTRSSIMVGEDHR